MRQGDRPVDLTHGPIERPQEPVAIAPGVDEQTVADSAQPSASQCAKSAQALLDAAGKRDEIAHARDLAALSRDVAADVRDQQMGQLDAASERDDGARVISGAEIAIRAAGRSKRGARLRSQAAEQRELAAEDRHRAARDRELAARERLGALTDRDALAGQMVIVETDALTGARAQAAGLADLDHELDRCRETGGQLAVACVDVVALEDLSDAQSRGASDQLLRRVVVLIGAQLRSFDLIARLGDHEFLCAMSNTTLTEARQHFSQVAAALAPAPHAGAIRVGFAEFRPSDSAVELIARAKRVADRQPPWQPGQSTGVS